MLVLLNTAIALTHSMKNALTEQRIDEFDELEKTRGRIITEINTKAPNLDESTSHQARLLIETLQELNEELSTMAVAEKKIVYQQIKGNNLSKKMTNAYKS